MTQKETENMLIHEPQLITCMGSSLRALRYFLYSSYTQTGNKL